MLAISQCRSKQASTLKHQSVAVTTPTIEKLLGTPAIGHEITSKAHIATPAEENDEVIFQPLPVVPPKMTDQNKTLFGSDKDRSNSLGTSRLKDDTALLDNITLRQTPNRDSYKAAIRIR